VISEESEEEEEEEKEEEKEKEEILFIKSRISPSYLQRTKDYDFVFADYNNNPRTQFQICLIESRSGKTSSYYLCNEKGDEVLFNFGAENRKIRVLFDEESEHNKKKYFRLFVLEAGYLERPSHGFITVSVNSEMSRSHEQLFWSSID